MSQLLLLFLLSKIIFFCIIIHFGEKYWVISPILQHVVPQRQLHRGRLYKSIHYERYLYAYSKLNGEKSQKKKKTWKTYRHHVLCCSALCRTKIELNACFVCLIVRYRNCVFYHAKYILSSKWAIKLQQIHIYEVVFIVLQFPSKQQQNEQVPTELFVQYTHTNTLYVKHAQHKLTLCIKMK